jgi:hypothetical protein
MKEMYVTLNPFTRTYLYYESRFGEKDMKNRKELGIEGISLVQKLSFIDLKRNSVLHSENLPSEELEKLKDYFSKSKVILA